MKKVIIIGASGFLGNRLLADLLNSGYEVLAIEHKTNISAQPGLSVVSGGISSLTAKVISDWKPEIVFHCARPTMPAFRSWGRRMAAKLAAHYNHKLIRQLQKLKQPPVLVFASGSLMYGNSLHPHLETDLLSPISYARQYHKGEIPFLKAIEEDAYPIRMLRFPWLLGNASWFSWFYLKSIQDKKMIPLFGSGDNQMQILDIRDASQLMISYAEADLKPGIYNIHPPSLISQKDFTISMEAVFSVPTTDYKNIFPSALEKEAMEAFTSNIIMDSHCKLSNTHQFVSLKQSLQDLKKAND